MGLRPETLTGDFATPARSHFQRPVLQSPAFFPAVIRSVLSVPPFSAAGVRHCPTSAAATSLGSAQTMLKTVGRPTQCVMRVTRQIGKIKGLVISNL